MWKVTVEENIRSVRVAQLVEITKIRLARSDQQNIHSAMQKGANFLPFDHWVLFGRSKNQRPVGCAQHTAQRLRELRKKWMYQVWNDESYSVRAAARQPARHHIGLIIQLLHSLQHAPPGGIAYVGISSENLRDRNNRHPKFARNIFQPDSHTCPWNIILQVGCKPTSFSRIWCVATDSSRQQSN